MTTAPTLTNKPEHCAPVPENNVIALSKQKARRNENILAYEDGQFHKTKDGIFTLQRTITAMKNACLSVPLWTWWPTHGTKNHPNGGVYLSGKTATAKPIVGQCRLKS